MPAASWLMNLGFAGGTAAVAGTITSVQYALIGSEDRNQNLIGTDNRLNPLVGGEDRNQTLVGA